MITVLTGGTGGAKFRSTACIAWSRSPLLGLCPAPESIEIPPFDTPSILFFLPFSKAERTPAPSAAGVFVAIPFIACKR